jgi:hypothetical protein
MSDDDFNEQRAHAIRRVRQLNIADQMQEPRAHAIRSIEHRLAMASGQGRHIEAQMLLHIAEYINDIAINTPKGRGVKLRDKYLALKDKYTGEYILAPYIWADLGRRESNGEVANSAEQKS